MTESRVPHAPPWPLLLAQTRHLLLTEGYGQNERTLGRRPIAALSRTGRALIAGGPKLLPALERALPELEEMRAWPALRALILEGPSEATSDLLVALGEPPTELAAGPESDDEAFQRLWRRFTYLHNEEFDEFGHVMSSKSTLALRLETTDLSRFLELYFDNEDPDWKPRLRRLLSVLGVAEYPEEESEAKWRLALSAHLRMYPTLLRNAPESRLQRLEELGVWLRPSERRPSPSAEGPGYVLCDGRFVIGGRYNDSTGTFLDIGVDRSTGAPILVSKLFVYEGDQTPPERALALTYEGITPMLFLGQVELSEGFANVLIEELPPGRSGDLGRAMAPRLALRAGASIAELLTRVHAAGELIYGLRPELTFLDEEQRVTLAPRGDLFRRLCWEKGQRFARQLPPFENVYLAPEIIQRQAPTSASDLYALCLTLVSWMSGAHPYTGKGIMNQLLAMANEAADCSTLPPELRPMLVRGLNPDPHGRPGLDELHAWLVEQSTLAG